MAEANVLLAQDQFSCPICLDLLKDPVTIPCGHSYCMDCITDCWDQEDKKGVYSCPQCRQTFTPRPALGRNTMLAEVVEKLKIVGLKPAPPAQCYAGPGDVECDVCVERKRKAVKSCLVCLSSYCEIHLGAHNDLNPGKKHKIIDAAGKLEDLICSHHDKLLEVFCRTDQTCICVLCVMDEHSGHKTVSVAAERTEKQKQLGDTQIKSHRVIQEKEDELQALRQSVKTLQSSAQTAVEDSERVFTEMIHSIERRRSEITKLIRDQERTEMIQAKELMEKLEQEIAELKKRDTELEELSQSGNHIRFLQSFQSLSSSSIPERSSKHTVHTDLSFDEVKGRLSQLRETLDDALQQGIKGISRTVELVSLPSVPEPKTREDFLKYACQLTLDPNTANNFLSLSEGNRVVENRNVNNSYPDHPDRFDKIRQVLCDAVPSRCYWEVEWSGSTLYISVSGNSLKRKGNGDETAFGHNFKSWSLWCRQCKYTFRHDGKQIALSRPTSSRVGVYVDQRAGTLCFYSITDTDIMTLLHKVETTFTEPLFPGFWLSPGSKVKLCL